MRETQALGQWVMAQPPHQPAGLSPQWRGGPCGQGRQGKPSSPVKVGAPDQDPGMKTLEVTGKGSSEEGYRGTRRAPGAATRQARPSNLLGGKASGTERRKAEITPGCWKPRGKVAGPHRWIIHHLPGTVPHSAHIPSFSQPQVVRLLC